MNLQIDSFIIVFWPSNLKQLITCVNSICFVRHLIHQFFFLIRYIWHSLTLCIHFSNIEWRDFFQTFKQNKILFCTISRVNDHTISLCIDKFCFSLNEVHYSFFFFTYILSYLCTLYLLFSFFKNVCHNSQVSVN